MDDLRLGTSFEPKQVYEILSVLKSTLSETVRILPLQISNILALSPVLLVFKIFQ